MKSQSYNDVLKKIRIALNIDESEIVEIFRINRPLISNSEVHGYLQNEKNRKYVPIFYENLVKFLDALIFYKRGPGELN